MIPSCSVAIMPQPQGEIYLVADQAGPHFWLAIEVQAELPIILVERHARIQPPPERPNLKARCKDCWRCYQDWVFYELRKQNLDNRAYIIF